MYFVLYFFMGYLNLVTVGGTNALVVKTLDDAVKTECSMKHSPCQSSKARRH